MLLTNKADILDAMDKELAEASPSSIKWLASMFNKDPELKNRRVVSFNDWVKILRDHSGVSDRIRVTVNKGHAWVTVNKGHVRTSVTNRRPSHSRARASITNRRLSQKRQETIDRTFRIQGISYDSMNKPAFLDILDVETKEQIRVRI